MAKTNSPPSTVSDDLFHAAATLAAQLALMADQECNIDPVELLVLWHLKHHGQPDDENRPVMLRHDLTNVLKKNYRYSDSDVSKMLDGLHDHGLVEKGSLTTQERDSLFGSDAGAKLAVRLQSVGGAKIEEFKNLLRKNFDTWLSQKSKATQLACRKFEPIARGFAQWLLEHYQPPPEKDK